MNSTHKAIVALAGSPIASARRGVWPRLKQLSEEDPSEHLELLSTLEQHHAALHSTLYRVHSIDDIPLVRSYAPFTRFELVVERLQAHNAIATYIREHDDIQGIVIEELDASPLLNIILSGVWKSISLECCNFSTSTFAELFKYSGLSGLQSLNIAEGWCVKPSILAMTTSPHLSNLRHLSLTYGERVSEFFAELANWPQFGLLKSLDLRCCDLREQGTQALASIGVRTTLEHLHLGSNEMGDDGLKALTTSPLLKNLRSLVLAGDEMGSTNSINDDGIIAFSKSPYIETLQTLDLSGNRIGDLGARALAGVFFPNLETLNVGSNYIGDDGAQAIINSSNFPKLTNLDLSHNSLFDETAEALIRSTLLTRLQTLNLIGNRLTEAGISALKVAKPDVRTSKAWS